MKTLQMPRVLGAAGDGPWARVAVWGLVCVLLRGGPYNKQRRHGCVPDSASLATRTLWVLNGRGLAAALPPRV